MAQATSCGYCGKTFTARRASAVYCSDSCRVRASRDRRYLCWYCGDHATQRDHVIPHSLVGEKVRRWAGVDLVECCPECNSLLGTNLFQTMAQRCAFLAVKLRKKHRLASGRVEWSEEELCELTGSLQSYIRGAEATYWRNWRRYNHVCLRAAQIDAVDAGDEPSQE